MKGKGKELINMSRRSTDRRGPEKPPRHKKHIGTNFGVLAAWTIKCKKNYLNYFKF